MRFDNRYCWGRNGAAGVSKLRRLGISKEELLGSAFNATATSYFSG
jgi:hypothetical protein